jgi:hypothetical protein
LPLGRDHFLLRHRHCIQEGLHRAQPVSCPPRYVAVDVNAQAQASRGGLDHEDQDVLPCWIDIWDDAVAPAAALLSRSARFGLAGRRDALAAQIDCKEKPIRSSETRPPKGAGTPSSVAAIREADSWDSGLPNPHPAVVVVFSAFGNPHQRTDCAKRGGSFLLPSAHSAYSAVHSRSASGSAVPSGETPCCAISRLECLMD